MVHAPKSRGLPIVDDAPAPPSPVAGSDADRTLLDEAWFTVRAWRHQLVRAARDGIARGHRVNADTVLPVLLAQSRTPLFTSDDSKERPLVRGKIENLRVAVAHVDGVVLAPGELFSFWRAVGPPWQARGFVLGRELRGGCLVPAIGGGLCQLSNALYGCALDAGATIHERHAHTARIVGTAGATDRDATVFWNYVDLRFAFPVATQVRAWLSATALHVELRAAEAPAARAPLTLVRSAPAARPSLRVDDHACDTCDQGACGTGQHARAKLKDREAAAGTAWLVDEVQPELQQWMRARAAPRDVLCLPLPGAALGLPQYAWDTTGLTVRTAPTSALLRARTMRSLGNESARRVQALLLATARLAQEHARHVPVDVDHVVVDQTLLPFLHRAGALGGRRVTVFLHRPPLSVLHTALDAAAARYPEDALLQAYRAPGALVEAEGRALADAAHLVTARSDLRALFPNAERVPFVMPAVDGTARTGGNTIAFLGPVSGRKGAHAVRDAARGLGLRVIVVGTHLLPADFWRGVDVQAVPWARAMRARLRAVVHPAFVVERPRLLLEAAARGFPVVTTPAAGLDDVAGVHTVLAGDTDALCAALTAL